MTVIDEYNDAAEQYAKTRIGTEDKAELAKFESLLKPGSRVLDAGCAAGRDTGILKSMGFEVIGCDLAEKLLEIAKKSYPEVEFVHADIRSLPFDDGSFRGVWASAVLHHFEEKEMKKVINEFHRVLGPEGVLYIHTKSGEGQLKTTEDSMHGNTREFNLINPYELDSLLTDCGFHKLFLEVKASVSRPGLSWVNAFYRRS